jgi:hypothetical protein
MVCSLRRSQRICCRPVCPVRPAKAKNVTFYPSAAAAENDGFRPCFRCRPETAPFSPAWKGSQTTVERAVQLISNGALDDAGVEVLAERLGIGPRHLMAKRPIGCWHFSEVAQCPASPEYAPKQTSPATLVRRITDIGASTPTATSPRAASTTGSNRHCRRSSGRRWCRGRTAG